MGRVIANDHLWDDSEVAYQLARDRRKEVRRNREQFGSGAKAPKPASKKQEDATELDEDIYEYVLGLDDDGLREALQANGIAAKGSRQELKSRLAQKLQAVRHEPNR